MQRLLVMIVILLLCSTTRAQQGANPQERCRKSLKASEFLLPEDAVAAKGAFETFRKALLNGDREQVVSLMSFPVDLVLNGYGIKFDSAKQFMEKYEDFFTARVIESVSKQSPDELLAGWGGVSLSDGAVGFARNENGEYRVSDIRPKQDKLPDSIAEFLDRRLTCPPVVAEGRIVAYDLATHKMPGFENIYLDHLIVDVDRVLSGTLTRKRIRVDFWGVTHLPNYNLPEEALEPGSVWRMYLRPSADSPSNDEVCGKDIQESISFVDESGRELEKHPAVKVLIGHEPPTYVGLPCFEVNKQFFSTKSR